MTVLAIVAGAMGFGCVGYLMWGIASSKSEYDIMIDDLEQEAYLRELSARKKGGK